MSRRTRRCAGGVASVAALMGLAGTVLAATDEIVYRSEAPSGPADMRAVIEFPTEPADRYAAVIILHTSAGIRAFREPRYARLLREAGAATVVLDSFAPRRLQNTTVNQVRLTSFDILADAFGALRAVAEHPRIDPARVAVLGLSKGGISAVLSSLESVRRRYVDGPLRFAVHVAMYPGCNLRFRDWSPAGGPVQMQLGEKDTWTGVAPCQAQAEALRGGGGQVDVIVHPGAPHAWDGPNAFHLAQVSNLSDCILSEGEDGAFYETTTKARVLDSSGAVLTDGARVGFGACSRLGVEGGPDEAATRNGTAAAVAFLSRILKLP